MTFGSFLTALASYLMMIPSAALCLFPMHNRLRYSVPRLIGNMALLLGLLLPVAALTDCLLHLSSNTLMLPLLVILFVFYHLHLTVHISQSLAVFCFISSLMSVLTNFTDGINALLSPHSGPDEFSLSGALIHLALSGAAAGLLYVPLHDYGSRMIDRLHLYNIWYATLPISCVFLALNLVLRPDDYAILRNHDGALTFFLSVSLVFFQMLLLAVMFYFIVKIILNAGETEQRNRILEAQERQYRTQRDYIEESARVRHDFRQTIIALKALSDEKDYQAIDDYLDRYVRSLPKNEITQYCRNNAVNALFNYYAQLAAQDGIILDLRIQLPDELPMSDIDLCGMIGNILENAVTACRALEQNKRWIQFTALTQNDSQLCIVATNSFDGKVRQSGGRYLSTHRDGKGTGLLSIATTAAKYGGTAEFSHENGEFYTDVMIPIA